MVASVGGRNTKIEGMRGREIQTEMRESKIGERRGLLAM